MGILTTNTADGSETTLSESDVTATGSNVDGSPLVLIHLSELTGKCNLVSFNWSELPCDPVV